MGRVVASIFVLITAVFTIATAQTTSSTTVPRLVRFHGKVSPGAVPPSGIVGAVFALYKEQEGGTALWTESQNLQVNSAGEYSILLGSEHADGMPAELFSSNEARWLGVQVEGEAEQPRVLLVSVPYALKAGDAETLGGRPLADFVLSPAASSGTGSSGATGAQSSGPAASSARASTVRTSTLNTNSTGAQNYIAKWIDNAGTLGNSVVSEVGGFLGINTSVPAERLDIGGGSSSNYLRVTTGSNSPGTKAGFYAANAFGSPIWRIQGDASSGAFDLSTGPGFTSRMAIDANTGYIGFGTTTPQERIDIAGGSASSFLRLAPGTNSNGAKAGVYAVNALGTPLWRIQGDASSGLFELGVGPNFASRLAINYSTGNVGYGTAAPQERIDIAGGSGSNYMRIAAGANGAGTKAGIYAVNASGTPMWRLQGDTSSGQLDIGVGASFDSRITIDYATGNVGIGSSNPGQKLSVAGIIESTSGGIKFPDGSTMSSSVNIASGANYYAATNDQVLHVSQNGPGAGVLSVTSVPSAIRGDAATTSNYVAGVSGSSMSPFGYGVVGANIATTGTAVGLLGDSTQSTGGTGVLGQADATSGDTIGVEGKAYSSNGTGIYGWALASTGDAVGVYGVSQSSAGTGIWGEANATSGPAYGVYGRSSSNQGAAGVFDMTSTGNILVGRSGINVSNVFRVDNQGKGYFNGGTQTSGADFAELVAVTGPAAEYEPGDVMVIDDSAARTIALSSKAYDTSVAGIYSTRPGVLASEHNIEDKTPGDVPLAVVGIVPCKVTAANGAIHPGDLLVTSSLPGYAMKGTERQKMLGAVVGKAMGALSTGTGVIQVLVSLH